MPNNMVKTPADEKRWDAAKKVVEKASKKPESEFKDAHWAQVNSIFQKMGGKKPAHFDDGGSVEEPSIAVFSEPYTAPPAPAKSSGGGSGMSSMMSMLPMLAAMMNKGGEVKKVPHYDSGGMIALPSLAQFADPYKPTMPAAPTADSKDSKKKPAAKPSSPSSPDTGLASSPSAYNLGNLSQQLSSDDSSPTAPSFGFSPDMNKGGKVKAPVNMKQGGKVPGKPKVAGKVNTEKNDTVPAMLSPGEVVLPRSVTQAPNASQRASDFVRQQQAKKMAKGGQVMPSAPKRPTAAEALQRLKQQKISPHVLAALHMAHPQAAQALSQANNIHPAVAPALAQMLQERIAKAQAANQGAASPQPNIMPPAGVQPSTPMPPVAASMPTPPNMAKGGMVQQHNKAVQAALGQPNMPIAKPEPKSPKQNPMISPIPNMAKGGELGSGERFHALAAKIKAEGHSAESANAIAAAAGRKAHGEKQMEKWSKEGKKK